MHLDYPKGPYSSQANAFPCILQPPLKNQAARTPSIFPAWDRMMMGSAGPFAGTGTES